MAVALATVTLPASGAAQVSLSPRDSAVQALERLAYGATPGQVDRVDREGVWHWIERQLDPESIDDRVLAEREHEFALLDYSRDDLAEAFFSVQRKRRELQRTMTARGDSLDRRALRRAMGLSGRELRELGGQVSQLVVVRAVVSNRQLEEVMVDFWTNHFNVYQAKGLDRVLLPAYIEETIRPHVFGRFEDLLVATARDPAMMFYLDNMQSVAEGARPPELDRQLQRVAWARARTRARAGAGARFRGGLGVRESRPRDRGMAGYRLARADSMLRRAESRLPRGLNENYARELMELHTLGVDGGYTQKDVVAVARVLTGWGIDRRGGGIRFRYRDWAHDHGAKSVLGETFPAGHGEDEGLRLLSLLAHHPATRRHISTKLCQRFVADGPPAGCVSAAVAAWEATDGDIREVLRAIFRSPDFWAPANRDSKIKTPLEFAVSATRALGATPSNRPGLSHVVAQLGQPLYHQAAPTGYPETQEDWVNSGALLNRMNIALALAGNRLPGVSVDLAAVAPLTADAGELIDAVDHNILAGRMSSRTRSVILEQIAAIPDPADRRALAVGLALGGPEFKRQ